MFKREKNNSDPEPCSGILISLPVTRYPLSSRSNLLPVQVFNIIILSQKTSYSRLHRLCLSIGAKAYYHHRHSGIDETNILQIDILAKGETMEILCLFLRVESQQFGPVMTFGMFTGLRLHLRHHLSGGRLSATSSRPESFCWKAIRAAGTIMPEQDESTEVPGRGSDSRPGPRAGRTRQYHPERGQPRTPGCLLSVCIENSCDDPHQPSALISSPWRSVATAEQGPRQRLVSLPLGLLPRRR